ncbi:MAG TPA: adenylate/guanylate cyclase domain-containing protein [Methylomirabilota bacterium]|nr:adenylate/guanylate cyclase domain-containing protein [Methylomirabilota bacterium]
MKPETRYARSGDVNIAYQVVGRGPRDLVFVPGWVSNVELLWEEPTMVRFIERLASFSRLILFDKRGTGLSDRVANIPDLETRMDDLRAVMDAVGSARAALLGVSEGGPMSVLFAATYPERTAAMIMIAGFPRRTWAPDYPWGPKAAEFESFVEKAVSEWGGTAQLDVRAPSLAHDARFCEWYSRLLRMSASPGAVRALMKMNAEIDVRHVLPAVRVPTLILHRTGDRLINVEHSRYTSQRIPGATYIELPGNDHIPWVGDADAVLDEIEEFLTGVRQGVEADRVLATILFTDIVDATRRAAELGDRRWRDVLQAHHATVRGELGRFRGREIDNAGDGFLASFDGPARAVRAGCSIAESVRRLGLEIRAGVHTGECEVIGDKLGGIAVHIGARVAALAQGGEVLVSSTVKDLVAGSGLRFEDRGVHALKGVPGEWHLFAVGKDRPS